MKEIYQLVSGALSQEMRLTQIANNLANVNTPGFKKDGSVFQDFLQASINARQGGQAGVQSNSLATQSVNSAGAGLPFFGATYTDFRSGALQPSGQPLDLAIEGDGFFMIEGPNKTTQYSRAGNFRISDQGELVTVDGRRVLSTNNTPIAMDMKNGKPEITSDGQIKVKGSVLAQIGVVNFPDNQKLVKIGSSLFEAPQGVTPQPMAQPGLRQGWLEGSNVNSIDEMVRMIETQRNYGVDNRVIQVFDELAQKRIEAAK